MNKIYSNIIAVLLLILTVNAHADVASCGTQIAVSLQTSEKAEVEIHEQKITTKTTHVTINKKSKRKSTHLGMFKLLLPDTSKNN